MAEKTLLVAAESRRPGRKARCRGRRGSAPGASSSPGCRVWADDPRAVRLCGRRAGPLCGARRGGGGARGRRRRVKGKNLLGPGNSEETPAPAPRRRTGVFPESEVRVHAAQYGWETFARTKVRMTPRGGVPRRLEQTKTQSLWSNFNVGIKTPSDEGPWEMSNSEKKVK